MVRTLNIEGDGQGDLDGTAGATTPSWCTSSPPTSTGSSFSTGMTSSMGSSVRTSPSRGSPMTRCVPSVGRHDRRTRTRRTAHRAATTAPRPSLRSLRPRRPERAAPGPARRSRCEHVPGARVSQAQRVRNARSGVRAALVLALSTVGACRGGPVRDHVHTRPPKASDSTRSTARPSRSNRRDASDTDSV